MNSRIKFKGNIGLLGCFLLLILSTVVALSYVARQGAKASKIDLSSEGQKNFKCSESEFAETSMGQYFEIRQALHFYDSIRNSMKAQGDASERLAAISYLLDGLNQELLSPQAQVLGSALEKLIESYPGSEKFKLSSGRDDYDLSGVYNFVEQDVHQYFSGLLRETLLPQNVWTVRGHDEKILSLGVRLGENTFARIGLFPERWHLHIFKSAFDEKKIEPREHYPVQALSLKVLGPKRFEIVDGSEKIRLTLKSAEELELIPYCEFMAGQGRKDQQASQRVLKSL